MADFKPRKVPIHPMPTFAYGMNNRYDASKINDFEIADCENFALDEGVLITEAGYVGWDNDPKPGPYWGGFSFWKSDGTMVNVRQRQGILEYAPDGDADWYECSLPSVGSPAETVVLEEIQPCFAALNDILIFTNGSNDVMSSSDGITWTIRAELPRSKVVFENGKNRLLFMAQTGSGRQYRFDWTNINDPLTIDATAFSLVDPNNYGYIVGAGLTPDGRTLIMKQEAVYSVSDYVDDGIIDINFIGMAKCTNHHTIKTTDRSVIWHSWDGCNEYIGGILRPIMGRISPVGRNNSLNANTFCAAYYNHKYRLSIPDALINDTINGQEYVFYLNMPREDNEQPYVITRNKRYYGMYFTEYGEFEQYGVDNTLYVGDSRPAIAEGSPAVYTNTLFAWINDYRDSQYALAGLDGEEQTSWFVTKFFTDNVPYYAKKFKKIFLDFKLTSTADFKISYRFVQTGSWIDVTQQVLAEQLDFLEGYGFDEGYGFSQDTLGTSFIDINNPEKPRGIQFKIEITTINDVSILNMAYSYILKGKFK